MVTFIESAAPGRDAAAIEAAIRVLAQKFGNRLVTSQAVRTSPVMRRSMPFARGKWLPSATSGIPKRRRSPNRS